MRAASIGFACILALAAAPLTTGVAQAARQSAPTVASGPAVSLPRPVGRCKTDAAVRQHCTQVWSACISRRQRIKNICQQEWRSCCFESAGGGPGVAR
ncbi:MAG: hypothetical protein ACHP84_00190 [Caulobacterales bacterium]